MARGVHYINSEPLGVIWSDFSGIVTTSFKTSFDLFDRGPQWLNRGPEKETRICGR